MFGRLFPKAFDNTYRGHWLGLVLLGLAAAVRLLQGAKSIVTPCAVAMTADGIPLDKFTPDAAGMVILLFALLGLSFVALGLIGLVALVRYRAMVPFAYLLFFADFLARKAIVTAYPTPRSSDTPIGVYVNYAVLGVLAVGFAASLLDLRKPPG